MRYSIVENTVVASLPSSEICTGTSSIPPGSTRHMSVSDRVQRLWLHRGKCFGTWESAAAFRWQTRNPWALNFQIIHWWRAAVDLCETHNIHPLTTHEHDKAADCWIWQILARAITQCDDSTGGPLWGTVFNAPDLHHTPLSLLAVFCRGAETQR